MEVWSPKRVHHTSFLGLAEFKGFTFARVIVGYQFFNWLSHQRGHPRSSPVGVPSQQSFNPLASEMTVEEMLSGASGKMFAEYRR